MTIGLTRRALLGTGAAGAVGVMASGSRKASAVSPSVSPITMVINQSPWFGGFRQLVELYGKETGNTITLDVNPYAGALEKVRNSLQANEGMYDLLAIDNNWMLEMFAGGFLIPPQEVDPDFKLDPNVSTYGDTIYWNSERKLLGRSDGKLMGVPINGNVEVLFYRNDLYEKQGLEAPETWEQALANAKKLADAPRTYGFIHRDDRTSVSADFANYMFSFGGDILKDPTAKDYTVVFNSAINKDALDFYLELGKAGGYPSPGSISQAQMIQLMAAGKAAHAVAIVGAWAQLDDPSKSAVVGKIDAALIPRGAKGKHASRAGHWIGGIARNVPKDRQAAALAFLNWFQAYDRQIAYTRFGAVPVRNDLAQSPLANEPKFRFLKAQAENSKVACLIATVPEQQQIISVLDVRLNEAVVGTHPPAQALNLAAEEIQGIMERAGYKTGRLPALP